uniref:Uncharacterized protein n=1 Tax=Oryza glumipatula TaxID=40148 RepID=A0A0E0B131_9ORYZ
MLQLEAVTLTQGATNVKARFRDPVLKVMGTTGRDQMELEYAAWGRTLVSHRPTGKQHMEARRLHVLETVMGRRRHQSTAIKNLIEKNGSRKTRGAGGVVGWFSYHILRSSPIGGSKRFFLRKHITTGSGALQLASATTGGSNPNSTGGDRLQSQIPGSSSQGDGHNQAGDGKINTNNHN